MLQIVGYLSMLSIIPAALLALGKWKRWILADIKLLVYIVLFRAVANAISFMLFVKKFNHSYFTAAYNILELLLLALYFSAQYKHHHLRKYYLVLVLITAIVFTVELTQSAIFPNMGKTATALSIIILCAIHAYKWLVFDTSKIYEIIVIIAFISFNLLSITTFAFANQISPMYYTAVYSSIALCNMFCNGLLYLALKKF